MKTTIPALSLLFVFLSNCAFSQVTEDASKVFPGADVVYTNFEEHLNISIKDGIPVGETAYNIDMLMMTDKINSMVSRYRVMHSGYSELKGINAYTKVPSGRNKYDVVKIREFKTTDGNRSGVFYDDTKITSFNFPALTQYAIAHLDYRLFHKDAHLFMPYFVPDNLPVLNTSFTVTVPEGINIKYIVRNDDNNRFEFSEEKKRRETVYKWTMKNIREGVDFRNAPDYRYFSPHVIIYITSYEDKNGKQAFLNSLDDLYNWNYSYTKGINQVPDNALKATVDSLIAGIKDPLKKTDVIYKWVQKNIKYVAFENGLEGFRPRQAADVFQKRYGDCKDMASILTGMLKAAGVEAYFTWIGTRDIPYRYSEIPLPIVDNHMIATVRIDGKWYFLDATNPHANLNLPPSSIQGKEALIALSDKEYKVEPVPVSKASTNLLVDSTFISLTDNGVKGFQKVYYHGYFGQDVYNSISYRSEKEKEDYVRSRMSKGSNKFKLGKFEINTSDQISQTAMISAEFEIPDYSKKIGDNYFINLNLEKLMENQVIDIEKRKVPMEQEFEYIIRQHHILEIPDNYKLNYVPEDFKAENNLFSISIVYTREKNRIIATQEVLNKTLMVFPADFEKWNQPMKSILSQYKQSIVLEKK